MKFFFLFFILVLFAVTGCNKETEIVNSTPGNLFTNKEITVAYVDAFAKDLAGEIGFIKQLGATDSFIVLYIGRFINFVYYYPDKSGYFYAYDDSCTCIANARQKKSMGQNFYNYTDPNGKYVIREFVEAAKNGGGFVEYLSEEGKKKLGYIKPIGSTNYFLGSDVKLDDI